MSTTHLHDLLSTQMKIRGVIRKDVVEYYGHANISKAYRGLEKILCSGPHPENILRGDLMKKIAELLEIPFEEVLLARARDYDAVVADAIAHQRSLFKPILFVQTEHGSSQPREFSMLNGTKKWMMITLPDGIADYPEEEQLAIVRTAIQKHYKDQEGVVPSCGKITAYHYCKTYETSYLFNIDGERISDAQPGYYFPSFELAGNVWYGDISSKML